MRTPQDVVLILGDEADDHAAFMLRHLRDAGHDAELIDSRWFPSRLGLWHDPDGDLWNLRLPSGRLLPHGSVRSVYWRCYNGVGPSELPDARQAFVAGNDARSLFESWLIAGPGRWVNGWDGFLLHQTKPAALARVTRLGVAVPRTLSGNDAGAARAFVAREGSAIFKPVQGGAHARRVEPRHLSDENVSSLRHAPVTLQEEVAGTNVRAFVAGEVVLGCEVRAATLDFRDDDDAAVLPHALPPEVRDECRRIAGALRLLWTGIDFRLTAEGRYVFLEANPSPMFLGFEARAGVPLTAALTGLLVG